MVRSFFVGVVVAAVYVCAGVAGLQLDAVGGLATVVWPPTGLAIAALWLGGPRLLPAVAVGALVTNLWTGALVTTALGIAAGNTLEALVAWALLRQLRFAGTLASVRDVVVLVIAALVGAFVAATLGAAFVSLVHADVAYGDAWDAWWLGDVLGALVVAPVLITFAGREAREGARGAVEVVAVACSVVVAALLTFGSAHGARPYMLFPVLLVAAVRLGPRGASLGILLASAVAVTMTALGRGPFSFPGQLRESLNEVQLFTAFTAVSFLVMAALAAEAARKRQDTQQARDEAEGASTRKTALLRAVSHELRTPLGVLLLQVERLRTTTEPAQPLAARMGAQLVRLNNLIESLLAQARVQTGHLAVSSQDVDVGLLLRSVVDDLAPLAEAKTLTLRCEAEAGVFVCSDPQLLRLVLTNLVDNAIKFTKQGGVIASVRAEEADVVVDVADSGVGIAAADHERVFRPFERADSSKNVAGVGLGLSLVNDIVHALGATISFDSQVGKGSTFTVRLGKTQVKSDG